MRTANSHGSFEHLLIGVSDRFSAFPPLRSHNHLDEETAVQKGCAIYHWSQRLVHQPDFIGVANYLLCQTSYRGRGPRKSNLEPIVR